MRMLIPGRVNDAHGWLVFQVTGGSVDMSMPYDERGPLHAGRGSRNIRVYACSDRDVGGALDTARSAALRRAYGASC